MSTRTQLAVYKHESDPIISAEVYIYRHCDGYPGTADGKEPGVLADIVPFLKRFNNSRGIGDTSYCTARLTQQLGNVQSSQGDDTIGNLQNCLSLGLDKGGKKGIHGDIEFFYHISPKAVKVYAVMFGQSIEKWELKQTVSLKEEEVQEII